MTTALALPDPNAFQVIDRMAQAVVKAGFAGKMTYEQALVVMMQGYELRIPPMAALRSISVINNVPTVSPQLMLAKIYDSQLMEDFTSEGDATRHTVTMKRKGLPVHTEVFTMDDATKLRLATKDNWKNQPATMLKWRAVAACARVVFPDVILGLYTPDEMGADTDEDGNIVETPKMPELPALIQDTPPANVDTTTSEITDSKLDASEARKELGNGGPHRIGVDKLTIRVCQALEKLTPKPRDASTFHISKVLKTLQESGTIDLDADSERDIVWQVVVYLATKSDTQAYLLDSADVAMSIGGELKVGELEVIPQAWFDAGKSGQDLWTLLTGLYDAKLRRSASPVASDFPQAAGQ